MKINVWWDRTHPSIIASAVLILGYVLAGKTPLPGSTLPLLAALHSLTLVSIGCLAVVYVLMPSWKGSMMRFVRKQGFWTIIRRFLAEALGSGAILAGFLTAILAYPGTLDGVYACTLLGAWTWAALNWSRAFYLLCRILPDELKDRPR